MNTSLKSLEQIYHARLGVGEKIELLVGPRFRAGAPTDEPSFIPEFQRYDLMINERSIRMFFPQNKKNLQFGEKWLVEILSINNDTKKTAKRYYGSVAERRLKIFW